jgi:hypothetical protein
MQYVMVVIDDLRSFRNEQILLDAKTDLRYARTSSEGIEMLRELIESGTKINELWLDHDLGEDDTARYGYDTIMPVVAWLEELGQTEQAEMVGQVYIHTANYSAVPVISDALRPYYRVERVNASDWFRSGY